VIPADLSHPDAPKRLFDQVSAAGIAIDYLINNAGYGVPGYYLDSTWDIRQRFIQVMVTAVTELTYLLMERRNATLEELST
jgi:short-subunit dehydrogenase